MPANQTNAKSSLKNETQLSKKNINYLTAIILN